MSYQVLAKKYRPQTFDDVIGQEVVTRTLKNSILHQRVANAYIFCGPRGVGKTTVARLVSKTLNCERSPDKGPCNKCDSCREVAQGNNIDVLEIDGASNRGIDEIRTLRENVKFSPSKGRFKIYIIDEVHMLTPEAFNALLKTLEEPPSHVKFIFATTEPQKVLPTILSRCQRFDFKKISPKMMLDRIMSIAQKEKIDIDEKAAFLIGRSSDGSLRDSVIILDQMVSFSGKKILYDDVIELLGMLHKDKVLELSDAVIEGDPGSTARILDGMISGGKDPVLITNSLIEHYRDLMILKTAGAPTSDMAFAANELKKMEQQLGKLSLEEILYILQNLSHCLTLMKGTMFARAPLEISLIRLARRGSMLLLPKVLEKLEKAEKGYCISGAVDTHVETGRATGNERQETGNERQETGNERQETSGEKQGTKHETREANGNGDDNGTSGSDFNKAKVYWKSMLNYVKNKKMSVFTFLSVASPVEFSKNKVVIGFGKDHAFNKEAIEMESNRSIIEEAVNKVTGGSPRVEFTLLEFLGESAEKSDDGVKRKIRAKETMKPFIEKAMDVFGGHVVRDFMEDQK